MAKAREEHGMDMMFFMLTNILTESTELLCEGQGAEQLIAGAFRTYSEEGAGVKDQLLGPLPLTEKLRGLGQYIGQHEEHHIHAVLLSGLRHVRQHAVL